MRLSAFPLVPRKKNTDKGHYGHALLVAGSSGMSGAPQLAAAACLRSGAGLVTAAVPRSVVPVFAKKALAEAMCLSLAETKAGVLSPAAYPKIVSFIRQRRVNALAVGPGLSHEAGVSGLVRKLIQNVPVPAVLDADGLNAFSARGGSAFGGKGWLDALKKHRGPLVLTPHRGEFERLFSEKWPEQKNRRASLAKKLSRSYDVTLVLKGHRTLVARRDRVYENPTGNPGMAKGGAGDVLTGILAAFLAQGLDPFKAACWAVYFHGKAGDLAAKSRSELGVLASDIIECLPRVFRRKKLLE